MGKSLPIAWSAPFLMGEPFGRSAAEPMCSQCDTDIETLRLLTLCCCFGPREDRCPTTGGRRIQRSIGIVNRFEVVSTLRSGITIEILLQQECLDWHGSRETHGQ